MYELILTSLRTNREVLSPYRYLSAVISGLLRISPETWGGELTRPTTAVASQDPSNTRGRIYMGPPGLTWFNH